jgi:uncharacterized protein (DUF362 family)
MNGEKAATRNRPVVVVAELSTYTKTIPQVLDGLGVGEVLAGQQGIVVKPNLIQANPPPVTTDVRCVEAVVAYCRDVFHARLIVADGAGGCETSECFARLGYERLAREYGVELVDLNHAETVTLSDPCNIFLREFHIPKVLLESYLISVPVLKAHSMAQVTLGMKNMLGVAPEADYGKGGHYKKWGLHEHLDQAIMEINKFRKPDLTVIDAAIGMARAHLWGPRCDPAVSKVVASFDVVAADKVGCDLLGIDWKKVRHLRLADGLIGSATSGVRQIEV